MSEEKEEVWRCRISRTSRGAIFKAKRWFYATFYRKDIPDEIKEKSRRNWIRLARALVEKINKEGVSDWGATIAIYYKNVNGVFTPIRAEVSAFEIRDTKTFTVYPEEETEETEG